MCPALSPQYFEAEAIVLKGIEMSARRNRSVALAVAAQFEFTISQIDAIATGCRRGTSRSPAA